MKTMNNFQISGFVVNNATIGFRNPQYRGMEEQRGS